MPSISDKHPEYVKFAPRWTRCRDATEGQDSIAGAREKYLSRLPGQDDTEYNGYLSRALWYNAAGRTLDGLTGLAMATPPDVIAPSGAQAMVDDFDLQGIPLHAFADQVLDEVMRVGRCAVLVDYPRVEGEASIADAEAAGVRPYAILYRAEDVINWEVGKVGNHRCLTKVVIAGIYLDEGGKPNPEYRELALIDGIYHVRTWRNEQVVEDVTPSKAGAPIRAIPFWFIGPEFVLGSCLKPPLLDLIDVNISHYRTMADLEHGRFFCGLPTPVFTGFQFQEGATIKLGSLGGITGPQGAQATYLEFQGTGLSSLERAAEQKEGMMAKLGARMLAEDKKSAETAETTRIRASGESSSLASISRAVSGALTKILAFMCEWHGVSGDASVQISTDYEANGYTAQDLTALMQLWQGGGISYPTFFGNLKRAGVVPNEAKPEDELETIGAVQPSLGEFPA